MINDADDPGDIIPLTDDKADEGLPQFLPQDPDSSASLYRKTKVGIPGIRQFVKDSVIGLQVQVVFKIVLIFRGAEEGDAFCIYPIPVLAVGCLLL